MKNAVALFAKYPQPGSVKTRLAREIGNQRAADLYAQFLKTLTLHHSHRPYDLIIAFTPPEKEKALKIRLNPDPTIVFVAQEGENLGERMENCFRTHLKVYTKLVIIGSDMPHLTHAMVNEAFDRLDKTDIVLGPAEDGGYYLIGMKKAHSIFDRISWSRETVLEEQLKNIKGLGLTHALLEREFDIDTLPDLHRFHNLPGRLLHQVFDEESGKP